MSTALTGMVFKFQSPYGDCCLSDGDRKESAAYPVAKVSVPLRGLLSFRPGLCLAFAYVRVKFQSPYGDCCLSDHEVPLYNTAL